MQLDKNRYELGHGWHNQHASHLDSPNTLIIFFADKIFEGHQAIKDLVQAFPQSQLVGCSTAGEVLQGEIYDNSMVYVVIKMEKTSLRLLSQDYTDKNNLFECGKHFANQLYSYDLNHILLFTSGLNINIDDFIKGFKANAGRDIPLFGGIAGDGERFENSWAFHGHFSSNMIIAVGLYGDNITMQQGCFGGWTKFGLERKITASKNNILYEIDNQPALQMYKKYLGDLANKLPSSALLFPLSIRKESQSESVVRTILSVDEASNAIIFAGEVPLGWLTSLMRCSKQGLINGAYTAAQMSTEDHDEAALSIIVSCVGRRMVLGQAAFHEISAVSNSAKLPTHMSIGFYSYGEIASRPDLDSILHNQTMTIATLSEK